LKRFRLSGEPRKNYPPVEAAQKKSSFKPLYRFVSEIIGGFEVYGQRYNDLRLEFAANRTSFLVERADPCTILSGLTRRRSNHLYK
jgi:hypothetical protein